MKEPNFKQNWGIIGHQAVVSILSKAVDNHHLHHAYLFVGPRGVGKRAVAQRFAQTLLGQPLTAEPPVHPDYYTIDTDASGQPLTSIGVDDIRSLHNHLAKSPLVADYQVALIPQAERLTPAASNALLKLLEEPHGKTIILLTVSDSRFFLDTLRSRCQQLHCQLVPQPAIYQGLVERGVDRTPAQTMAAAAAGTPGRAVNLAATSQALADYQQTAAETYQLLTGETGRALTAIHQLIKSAENTQQARQRGQALIDQSAAIIRDVLLVQQRHEAAVQFPWLLEKLKVSTLQTQSPQRLATLLASTEATKRLLQQNVSPQLALESFFLQIHL